MEKVCYAVPIDNMKSPLGHFNVKFGKVSYLYPACGGQSLHNETNDNGKQMLNFAPGTDLYVMGRWYQHKGIHKVTWQSPDNKIRNLTDQILVD